MSKLPAMPFFVDAYLADTRKLSLELRGIYTDLLFFMWSEGGKLRDNDEELAARVGLPVKKWLRVRPTLISFFIRYGNDEVGWWLTQKRLQTVWNYVQERSARQAEKGKKSGVSRREKAQIMSQIGTVVQPLHEPEANRTRTSKTSKNIPSSLPLSAREEADEEPPTPKRLEDRDSVTRLLHTNLMKRA